MPHPVADPAAPELAHLAPVPQTDRVLITDEEWQALLWPTPPAPCTPLASEAQQGASS